MRLLIIAFLLLTQQPSKPVDLQKGEQHAETKNQDQSQVVPISKSAGNTNTESQTRRSEKTDQYDPRTDSLYRWYMRATIIGVIVALIGIGAIYHQTKVTARAAVATERSVKLQENTQRQWVDLRDWRAYRIKPDQPVEIEFKITNPTILPLTIHGAVITVDGKPIDEELPIMLLTPNDPVPHSIGMSLNPEQNALYERNSLHFEVDCAIMFADSHNIHWIQEIGIRLLCGRSGNPIIAVRKHKLYESGVPGERGSRDVELPK